MTVRAYQICTNCIMDTSDSTLKFDGRGWCDYCSNYHSNILPNWHPDERGLKEIMPVIEKIKAEGKGREHDCLIGISGGVDSSYVTYIAKEKFGLRPLMFHCDAGWNSQLGVNNIEKMVEGLHLDLHTEVVNWQEMKDLQLAFFKAQVPFADTPQDLAFFAAMYNFAAKQRLQIRPHRRQLLDRMRARAARVALPLDRPGPASATSTRKFGTRPLKTFPICDIFNYKIYYRWVKGMRVVKLLDYVPYIKKDAMPSSATNSAGSPIRTSTTSRGSRASTSPTGRRRNSATTSAAPTFRASS